MSSDGETKCCASDLSSCDSGRQFERRSLQLCLRLLARLLHRLIDGRVVLVVLVGDGIVELTCILVFALGISLEQRNGEICAGHDGRMVGSLGTVGGILDRAVLDDLELGELAGLIEQRQQQASVSPFFEL